MAKDKSKKKADDTFYTPDDAPAGGGDEFTLVKDARDELVLITPLREESKPAFGQAGKNGETQQVIICDVAVINTKKPAKSEVHKAVWIFQRFIQGSIRHAIGTGRVAGRVRNTEDTTKARSSSGGYYWELENPSKKDVEAVHAYFAAANNPFAVQGTESDEDDEPKKGKKEKGEKKSKPAPEPEPEKKKAKKSKK